MDPSAPTRATAMRPLVCFFSGVLMWSWCVHGLRVDISPSGPLFKLGERGQLTCSVGECPVAPVVSWTPVGDRPLGADVRTRGRLSLLTFDPVEMEHEGPLLCKVTCGEQRKHAKTHISLYAFPSDPVIRGHHPVREGEESTLTCEVRDIYPAEMLTLDWLRGGQVVHSVTGEAGATAVQSTYSFTPQRAESGQNLTCRATLELRELTPRERTRHAHARIRVTFAPVVTALSDPGPVLSGSILVLRCSAAGDPAPVLTWTFRPEGRGAPQVKGHGGELVLAAQAGEYCCEAHNQDGKHSKAVRVQVNTPPSNTSMWVHPGREVLEGQRVTLACHSHGAPPPSLVLRRDGVELQRSDAAPSLTFSLTAQPQDSAQYQCDAANAFGTQQVTRHVNVTAHPLRVEVRPQVALPAVSSGVLLTCECSGCSVPPALTWTRTAPEGAVPPADWDAESLESRLLLRDVQPRDRGGYVCRATCDNVTRSGRATVHVYSLPSDPVVKEGGAVPPGQEARLRCDVRDVFPAERLRLSWRSGNESLLVQTFERSASPRNISAVLRHRADAERRLVSCEARLLTEAGAVWRSRKSSVLLTVHAPPRNTTVLVLPSAAVSAGQNVTVLCRSVGFPPPDVVLRKVSDGTERRSADGIFALVNVTTRDSGLYRVNVTNDLGHQVRVFRLTVTEPSVKTPPALASVLVPAAIGAVGLAAATLLMDHLRRSKKKRSYQLTPSAPTPEHHALSTALAL
ncbi:dual specificity protein phosphatase CDC14AB isoform X2 [Phyllopteryx taeniolatus]|uniref:dual specificity protein phosphatase CDC14AB isoform X2 n=1 Tax=Phyllopteryx taeniolatus TaxID=161469 RepID=UPI002AD442AB|nr:dual specificity protein phosphatase CDC14AB isoform X2 [Phyllopteryx taeniolatus]